MERLEIVDYSDMSGLSKNRFRQLNIAEKKYIPIPIIVADLKNTEVPEESEDVLNNTNRLSEESDVNNSKIFDIIPKSVAYGLGAVILLVGGFIIYKKFIAKKK